ncbi:MAG: Ribosomal large subunit pseudouridine synthase [Planctomycetota bacterium]|jgi:23S rRNA pseudouridine1911/1915/1917 synthase
MYPMQRLYEDNHLYVINKPAPLATMGAAPGQVTAFELAVEEIRVRFQKPGRVYLGVVSRLDAMVSGVLVFARTSKAAARLSEQFRLHEARKTYLALVSPPPATATARLKHWLRHHEPARRVETVSAGAPGGREAVLDYEVLASHQDTALLRINLLTGRKHQIRVQLAATGLNILGDTRYGSHRSFPRGIALHSASLAIRHPVSKQTMVFEAPLPDAWPKWALDAAR